MERGNACSQRNVIAREFERRYVKILYLERCSGDLEKNWHTGASPIKKASI
jgi:hypothetical protein